MDMRVLVTGGSGFIGSNFIHTILHLWDGVESDDLGSKKVPIRDGGIRVLNVDKLTYASDERNLEGIENHPSYEFSQTDICDREGMSRIFDSFKPEYVIHFAAESHVDRSIESGDVFVRTNVLGTQVLLDLAREAGIRKFVHVSTDEVYGSIKEGSFDEESRLSTSSPYSASKAGSDLLALAHWKTYGTPVSITRCTNNFGPRQHREKLLPKVITILNEGGKIPIYGDGSNIRDWLYVKDHCLALVKVMEEGTSGEIYNIGAQDEKTNLEIADILIQSFGKNRGSMEFVEDRAAHDWRYSVDDTKIRSIGWEPIFSFDEGLEMTKQWYLE